MNNQQSADGTVHKLPIDLKDCLVDNDATMTLWQTLTPLARNEFICWVESAKQDTTRSRRIERTLQELLEGKRRPCCWIGCVHRDDKPPSQSQKGILKL
jgi:uncharacterized protein YdeI (YjbR/CyaY-like superfamily)